MVISQSLQGFRHLVHECQNVAAKYTSPAGEDMGNLLGVDVGPPEEMAEAVPRFRMKKDTCCHRLPEKVDHLNHDEKSAVYILRALPASKPRQKGTKFDCKTLTCLLCPQGYINTRPQVKLMYGVFPCTWRICV